MLIDTHIHPAEPEQRPEEFFGDFYTAFTRGEKPEDLKKRRSLDSSPESIEEACREANLDKAFLLAVDYERYHSDALTSNEYIYENFLQEWPDLFEGIATVDPGRPYGEAAAILERAIEEFGFIGVKMYPSYMDWPVDDRIAYPIYAKCVEYDVPVIIHTGFTPRIDSTPNRSEMLHGRPALLEKVKQHFPDLKIIVEHMGWPWIDEAIFLCSKFPDMYAGFAAWNRYEYEWYAENISKFGSFVGFDRLVYGTEWPLNTPTEGIERFRNINSVLEEIGRPTISDENKEKVLGENAAELFDV